MKPAFKGDSSLLCPIWENLSSGYGIMIRLCRSIVHTPKAPYEVERNKKSGRKDKKLDWTTEVTSPEAEALL